MSKVIFLSHYASCVKTITWPKEGTLTPTHTRVIMEFILRQLSPACCCFFEVYVRSKHTLESVGFLCFRDSKHPKPPPGTKWKEVRHDNKVTWLASWTENIQGSIKYIMLNPSSRIKVQSSSPILIINHLFPYKTLSSL